MKKLLFWSLLILFIINSLIYSQKKEEWTAATYYYPGIDSTFSVCDFINNGRMRVPENLTHGSYYFTRFYLKDTICVKQNFTIETRAKNSPSEHGISSYDIYFLMYGLNNSWLVSAFMGDASSGNALEVDGDVIRDSPLLTFNPDNWNNFKFQFKNKVMSYSYNDINKIQIPYSRDFCCITFVLYGFKGNGSVDWFKVYDENDSLIYFEDFNDCNNLGEPPACSLPLPFNFRTSSNNPLCEGDTLTLSADTSFDNIKYSWSGPNGFTSNLKSPIILNANSSNNGEYDCTISNEPECTSSTSKIFVTVGTKPTVTISCLNKEIFCANDSTLIKIDNYNQNYKYHWSTGDSSSTIYAKDSGEYYVKVIGSNGCEGQSNIIKISITSSNISKISLDDSYNNNIDTTNFGNLISKRIFIKNTSNDTVIIRNLSLRRNIEFSYPLSQLPIVIPPNSIKEIIVYYNPSAIGEQRDTLVIDDICFKLTIPLVAYAIENQYDGLAKCNINIKLMTSKIQSRIIFEQPAPNPNSQGTNIIFTINNINSSLNHNITNNIKCELVDLLGTKYKCDYNISYYTKGDKVLGRISLNFSNNLLTGSYFLICKFYYDNEIFIENFPIIIYK